MKIKKVSLLTKILLYLLIIGLISLVLMLFIHQYTIIHEVSITSIFETLNENSVVGGIYNAIDSIIGFGTNAFSGYIIGWLTILYILTISTSFLILVVWILYKMCNIMGNILGLRRF